MNNKRFDNYYSNGTPRANYVNSNFQKYQSFDSKPDCNENFNANYNPQRKGKPNIRNNRNNNNNKTYRKNYNNNENNQNYGSSDGINMESLKNVSNEINCGNNMKKENVQPTTNFVKNLLNETLSDDSVVYHDKECSSNSECGSNAENGQVESSANMKCINDNSSGFSESNSSGVSSIDTPDATNNYNINISNTLCNESDASPHNLYSFISLNDCNTIVSSQNGMECMQSRAPLSEINNNNVSYEYDYNTNQMVPSQGSSPYYILQTNNPNGQEYISTQQSNPQQQQASYYPTYTTVPCVYGPIDTSYSNVMPQTYSPVHNTTGTLAQNSSPNVYISQPQYVASAPNNSHMASPAPITMIAMYSNPNTISYPSPIPNVPSVAHNMHSPISPYMMSPQFNKCINVNNNSNHCKSHNNSINSADNNTMYKSNFENDNNKNTNNSTSNYNNNNSRYNRKFQNNNKRNQHSSYSNQNNYVSYNNSHSYNVQSETNYLLSSSPNGSNNNNEVHENNMANISVDDSNIIQQQFNNSSMMPVYYDNNENSFDYGSFNPEFIETYGDEDEPEDSNEDDTQLACKICRGKRMCFCYFLKVRYYKFPSFFDLVDHQYKKWRKSVVKTKKI